MKKTYLYGMLMRPPQLGAIPTEGLIALSCEPIDVPSGHHTWGWVRYNRKLTAKEIYEYELEEVDDD